MNYRFILLFIFFHVGTIKADLLIEITKGEEGALPIAIVPFGLKSETTIPPFSVSEIISANLARSGRFQPVLPSNMLSKPTKNDQVDFRDWRALNVENLVIGELVSDRPGAFLINFRLYDVYKGEQITGFSIPTTSKDFRSAAHQISDIIYETLLGEPGAFNTRIAYITSLRTKIGTDTDGSSLFSEKVDLRIADADGYDPQTIVSSEEPLMSPAWSPDGRKIAYVSFERGQPSIWVQELETGRREKLTSYKGINGAPAWSPDGQQLALTLSKDGNPDIFIMNTRRKTLRPLTRHSAIDTEPAWSPDGKSIIFTSDRGGTPQIYKIDVGGGTPERITFDGKYNARASFASNGRNLTMVSQQYSDYRVIILDTSNNQIRVLSDGKLDESPSFAPNGSMIIYASRSNGKGVLAAVSTDGNVKQRLILQEGDVREPAWSPYQQ